MKLEIKQLSKKYGDLQVIHSLDLILPKCQTLVLSGPSGGGKSTLLRLMSGLETPDSGSIAFDGIKIVYEENSLRKYRRRLGIVFQSWNLFPHLNALENVMLPLYRVHGLSKEEAEARSLVLLQRFDLQQHMLKKPYELSGGQVQRVALIRAVAHNPKMLMLDEPTSALDPLMTSEVLELISELKKEKNNIIFITHHLNFARRIADQILFIAEGRVVEHGSVNEVLDHPRSELVKEYHKILSVYE
jgi:polar amino acid transport system ATP-binding protein